MVSENLRHLAVMGAGGRLTGGLFVRRPPMFGRKGVLEWLHARPWVQVHLPPGPLRLPLLNPNLSSRLCPHRARAADSEVSGSTGSQLAVSHTLLLEAGSESETHCPMPPMPASATPLPAAGKKHGNRCLPLLPPRPPSWTFRPAPARVSEPRRWMEIRWRDAASILLPLLRVLQAPL